MHCFGQTTHIWEGDHWTSWKVICRSSGGWCSVMLQHPSGITIVDKGLPNVPGLISQQSCLVQRTLMETRNSIVAFFGTNCLYCIHTYCAKPTWFYWLKCCKSFWFSAFAMTALEAHRRWYRSSATLPHHRNGSQLTYCNKHIVQLRPVTVYWAWRLTSIHALYIGIWISSIIILIICDVLLHHFEKCCYMCKDTLLHTLISYSMYSWYKLCKFIVYTISILLWYYLCETVNPTLNPNSNRTLSGGTEHAPVALSALVYTKQQVPTRQCDDLQSYLIGSFSTINWGTPTECIRSDKQAYSDTTDDTGLYPSTGIYTYSGTCIRRSPLGPDQLAVLQRWPAYTVYIEISYFYTCMI